MINIEVFRRVKSEFPFNWESDQENSHFMHKKKWIVNRANHFADHKPG